MGPLPAGGLHPCVSEPRLASNLAGVLHGVGWAWDLGQQRLRLLNSEVMAEAVFRSHAVALRLCLCPVVKFSTAIQHTSDAPCAWEQAQGHSV